MSNEQTKALSADLRREAGALRATGITWAAALMDRAAAALVEPSHKPSSILEEAREEAMAVIARAVLGVAPESAAKVAKGRFDLDRAVECLADYLARVRKSALATPSPAPSDTLEQREAIQKACAAFGAHLSVHGWGDSPIGAIDDDALEAAMGAAVSLPAREVSGERAVVERARDLLCDHVDVADARAAIKRGEGVGVWSMDALAAIRAALATTPAPREMEADLAEALKEPSLDAAPVEYDAPEAFAWLAGFNAAAQIALAKLDRSAGEG